MDVTNYTITDIAGMLASKVEKVCKWLLPQGRAVGNEWRVGNIDGAEGDSLGVNLDTKRGVWMDFATDTKGGDLIDLIQAVKKVGIYEAVDLARSFLGLQQSTIFYKKHKVDFVPVARPIGMHKLSQESLEYLHGRHITDEAIKMYCVAEITTNGQPTMVFPYFEFGAHYDKRDTLKDIFFIKYRPVHNKKGMYTSKESKPGLFGWQAMPNEVDKVNGVRESYLIICEGEIDALSFGSIGLWAVSVPRGGGAGEKQNWIEYEWEHLQLFDNILLCLDSDDAGKQAAKEIAKRIGFERCYIVDFGEYKDANGVLSAGIDLLDYVRSKNKPYDPSALTNSREYVDTAVDEMFSNDSNCNGIPLWFAPENIGLRMGECSVIAGPSGHGKSQVIGNIIVDTAARYDVRWCISSMEFLPVNLMKRMIRQACGGTPVDKSDEQIKYELAQFFGSNIWIYDANAYDEDQRALPDKMLDVFRFALHRYDIHYFVIDSLSTCGFAEDDYNNQKLFVERIAKFCRQEHAHVFIVCHVRKQLDESHQPNKYDIKGTSGITDMVDNVFTMWRNKQNTDFNECRFACYKQRNYDWEGSITLSYDTQSSQYHIPTYHADNLLETWLSRRIGEL